MYLPLKEMGDYLNTNAKRLGKYVKMAHSR